ncbi:MAG: TatD family hydrolase [Calditrichia bacterium]
MLIDTHTHLNTDVFEADRDEMLQRARDAGVRSWISLGVDVESSKQNIALAEQYDAFFVAAGIHPSEAHKTDTDYVDHIRTLSQHPKVVAIGEIGLDFYWDKSHHKEQYKVFRDMLDLGVEVERPVVIHNRDAMREMQWFFQEEKLYSVNGVMHCFAGNRIDARFYLDMDLHISFTANITYKNFDLDVVKYVPLDKILLETDSPYMAPQPFRQKRNEPAFVTHVAEKLAEIHNVSYAEICDRTTKNARRLFNLPENLF